jgi:hypothetical protein
MKGISNANVINPSMTLNETTFNSYNFINQTLSIYILALNNETWLPSMYVVFMQSGYHADRSGARLNCENVKIKYPIPFGEKKLG